MTLPSDKSECHLSCSAIHLSRHTQYSHCLSASCSTAHIYSTCDGGSEQCQRRFSVGLDIVAQATTTKKHRSKYNIHVNCRSHRLYGHVVSLSVRRMNEIINIYVSLLLLLLSSRIYWFYMQIRQLAQPDATLFTLTQTFRYLNCCCNFFLYSATSSLFRRELREIFQCSPPSNVQQTKTKITYVNQTTSVTRSRTASSPPTLNLTAIDAAMTTPAERETLLARSISAKVLQVDSVECLDLAPAQPRNGHVVSFKT